MKKNILNFFVKCFLTGVTFFICVASGKAQQLINAEDPINICYHMLDIPTGNYELEDCYDYIKIDGLTDVQTTIDKIKVSHLSNLRDSALQIVPSSTAKFITCLKASFGLDTVNNKITLLYQAIYADSINDVINGAEKKREYNTHYTNLYYKYTTSGFVRTNDTSELLKYRHHIKIDHDHKPTTPDNAYDAKNDAESVIFPFQEIAYLAKGSTGYIYFFNAALRIPREGPNRLIRHSLLLGTKELIVYTNMFGKSSKIKRNFERSENFILLNCNQKDELANLAHLCPPHCI